jgi:hypothetical protein
MGEVHRFHDYERRSREPDAQPERDPTGATIIVLPDIGERTLRGLYGPIKDMMDNCRRDRIEPPCDCASDDRP